MPRRARAATESPESARPSNSMAAAVPETKPMMDFISVDFPAPFAPRSATASPAFTSSDTSSSAVICP